MHDEYLTVEKRATATYTVKRSEFIGYVMPVKTPEEAAAFIDEIKTKHRDARHNVYAYILRDGHSQRYSDDGEPQGTAGIPVLDVLKKAGLEDCCIVVTRYFGGILLGGGGLVRAYSHTASLAVESAGIIKMKPYLLCKTVCDYALYGKLEALVSACGGRVTDSEFESAVEVRYIIPKENFDNFKEKLSDLSLGKAFSDIIDEQYRKSE